MKGTLGGYLFRQVVCCPGEWWQSNEGERTLNCWV